MDILKTSAAVGLLLAGMAGYYFLTDYSTLIRVAVVLGAAVVSAFVFALSEKGKVFFGFIASSKQELRKIVWPTKREANQTTLIVVIAVLILGLILWGTDTFLSVGLRWLIG